MKPTVVNIPMDLTKPITRRTAMKGAALAGLSLAALKGLRAIGSHPSDSKVAPGLPLRAQQAAYRNIFYHTDIGALWDCIPFYWEDRFHLFYVKKLPDSKEFGEGVPWYKVTTKDFVNYTDHGEMIARGSREEQDLNVYTGSVLRAEGRFHIYYCGHNGHFGRQNKPEEAIMHAVSDDLTTWHKVSGERLLADTSLYEPNDWRDPFVFWNPEAHEYWMLISARLNTGPSRRRGCLALCASRDLRQWETRPPFWTSNLYYTPECPDLFQMGDWWYLVFYEFSERWRVRYRMSRSLQGPWVAPKVDEFDGSWYGAAKTASDGRHRFMFGWNPSKLEENDFNRKRGGGNLVVHELVQEADGTLSTRPPSSVEKAFSTAVPFQLRKTFGDCEIGGSWTRVRAPMDFACALAGTMPKRCAISADVTFDSGTRGVGFMLRTNPDVDGTYYLRVEPNRNRLVFDLWMPGARTPQIPHYPHFLESERPLEVQPGQPFRMKILADDTVCVAYINDRIALTARMYNLRSGEWGVFVNEGSAAFEHIRLMTGAAE
jgi:beta-fructofuranosidase